MLAMVSYSRRPQSGHITCYLNRTYHVLLTLQEKQLDDVGNRLLWFLPHERSFPHVPVSRPV